MPTLRSLGLAGAILAAMLAQASPVAAHQSPGGCSSNRLDPEIDEPLTIARNGDTISFVPGYSNSGPFACGITDVTVTVRLPSPDGTPGAGQAVVATDDLDMPAGTPSMSLLPVDYTVDLDDGVFRSAAAVEISGLLHDGPSDSPVNAAQSAIVIVSRPHVTLSVSPDPASGPAPLRVAYTYLATNDSPFDPDGAADQPGVANAQVTDDRCAPITLTGGDADGDAVLDRGETWRYDCTTVFGAVGASVGTATFSGTSTLDARAWPTATAQSTVTAMIPGPSPSLDDPGPALRGLALSPKTFRAARSGPSIVARKPKVGSKVTFSLSEAGSVRFTVDRRARGRKVGKRCVRPRRANRMAKACTRWVEVKGSFSMRGTAGKRTFEFSGRIRGKRLAAGGYRLSGVATDSSDKRSATARARFTIVR